ncbi:hypothetical protein H8E77_15745 [bacterium]|nr:hypothetical protein [bacterium]
MEGNEQDLREFLERHLRELTQVRTQTLALLEGVKVFIITTYRGGTGTGTTATGRELEIAVLSHLADGIRCGDLYVIGSEEYADYREQLLPWEECETRLLEYCQTLGLPDSAEAFVRQLKDSLTQVANKVDDSYPDNIELTLDEEGRPHLKRLKVEPLPKGLEEFKEAVRSHMPERHLLDVLKHAHYWINYARHFTPPSGSAPPPKNWV